jgi:hypothetical protein
MWGFWDGAHYSGRAPLFDKSWNLKPGGKPFIDLVFGKWWTPTTTLSPDVTGKVSQRGFKGTYKITITAGAEQFVDTIKLGADLIKTYKQPFSQTTGIKDFKIGKITIFPNPATSQFTIRRTNDSVCIVNLLTSDGKCIKSFSAEGQQVVVPTGHLAAGLYLVEISDKEYLNYEKVMIR